MERTAFIFGSSLLVVASLPALFAQQAPTDSRVPEDAFSTRQLIAWSGMQKPQPAPQPLPPRDTPVPQPDQPQDQHANPPADPHTQETPTQSFTGKIVKVDGKFALNAGTDTYALDQQDGLEKFENEAVRVTGALDKTTRTIHILKIDLLS